jgi:hypothetical protein
MSNINDGGPAFPFPTLHGSDAPAGMSLRDYFAAKAMEGVLQGRFTDTRTYAEWAYEMADAMLKARGEP